MKEILEKYKEFKTKRRLVGITKLGFWLIFFGVILLIYYLPSSSHTSPTSGTKKEEKIETNENVITSYAFEYTINDQKYIGSFNGDTELIGDDYSFYISKDQVLTNKEDAVIPDYTYTNIHKIDILIEGLEPEETTNYKDGSKGYKYLKQEDNQEIIITKINNIDDTIDAHLEYNGNVVDIHYYDINKTSLKLDERKYKYELKEVENDEH